MCLPATALSQDKLTGVTIRLELRPSTISNASVSEPAVFCAEQNVSPPAPKLTLVPTRPATSGRSTWSSQEATNGQPLELTLDPPTDDSQLSFEDAFDAGFAVPPARSIAASTVSQELPWNENNEVDATECPGSPNSNTEKAQELLEGDLPLEQEPHPYDAPQARSPQLQPELVESSRTAEYSARELQIKRDIAQCLSYFLEHPENTTRRGPWALMHATLPYGVETEIIAGNRRVNAIGWMCFNGVCAKQRMFQPTQTGFRTNVGPGVQGHEGQFLAILAQSKVSADYPLQIGSKRYTVMDLARYEMATCREKSELTFKLIGLSHYLDQNQSWRDNRGHAWTLEKLVAEEIDQPIIGQACGGTHRLMGLSYALIKRNDAKLPIDGHWYRAQHYLVDYVNYAMSLQNPDGSFSTNWFESRGMDPDVERKVQTTGHILEWLIYTLPADKLRTDPIQDSIEFLLSTVGRQPQRDWPIGPRGHALRALALYNQRVFGVQPGTIRSYLAQQNRSASAQAVR